MVVVKLQGGLGNQMFQYAVGRSLALSQKSVLKLDMSYLRYDSRRHYSLNCFSINEAFSYDQDIAKKANMRYRGLLRIIRYIAQQVFLHRSYSVFRETQVLPFNPAVLKASGNVYLDGYWQSEKYFVGIGDVLRREFILRRQLSYRGNKILSVISKVNSVSVHVRRGDYVTDPEANRVHGVCGSKYYQKCFDLILRKISNPHFFVFSDDIKWAKDNLSLDCPMTFVDNDVQSSCEDLWLMSQCNHNIIANSSFSWWGAWLNRNPQKIVYAPQHWFNDPDRNTVDLVPSAWLRV